MNTFFEDLFAYNSYCNEQLAQALHHQQELVDEKSMLLFSHVLNAHQIWNDRLSKQPVRCGVWDRRPSDTFVTANRHNHEQTSQLLRQVSLSDIISYTTSSGTPFVNPAKEILFHIINHSTYHRGQIALLFRQNELDPLVSDYIFFKRS